MYIKYIKKTYFVKEYKNTIKGKLVEFTSQIEGTSECLIKYFTYYYSNGCYKYKKAKYRAG